jgi:uncharacterized tellurite resistance protein B-like protein
MPGSIERFVRERILGATARESPQEREHGLRLAAAALMFEVVRADADVKPEEITVMRAAIQAGFGLSREQADELVLLAQHESREAVSLYELTRVVDAGLDAEQKKRVVELLWLVAFADAEKHPVEEHLVRKVAGLLHVPHPDFIDAKIRARSQGSGGAR